MKSTNLLFQILLLELWARTYLWTPLLSLVPLLVMAAGIFRLRALLVELSQRASSVTM